MKAVSFCQWCYDPASILVAKKSEMRRRGKLKLIGFYFFLSILARLGRKGESKNIVNEVS